MKAYWQKIKDRLERYIPMTTGSLILFIFIIYLMVVVGKNIWSNYHADQQLDQESTNLVALQKQNQQLQEENNYYQTYSFKEKEARAKLGYIAPGEHAVALPIDTQKESIADTAPLQPSLKIPNYQLWWNYFMK